MNDKRPCPLFKGADVEVQVMCYRCGHYSLQTTACEQPLNVKLVKLGHMKQADFDKLHENMGVS